MHREASTRTELEEYANAWSQRKRLRISSLCSATPFSHELMLSTSITESLSAAVSAADADGAARKKRRLTSAPGSLPCPLPGTSAGEQARPGTRVQLCPAAALAAVAAGSNVAARGLIPVWVLEQSAETASQVRHPVPAEAVEQVEKWLLATRGSELRKAKSLETALHAVAHVAFIWSSFI